MPRYIAPDVGQLDSSVTPSFNGRIADVGLAVVGAVICRSQASIVSNELQPGSIILTSAHMFLSSQVRPVQFHRKFRALNLAVPFEPRCLSLRVVLPSSLW